MSRYDYQDPGTDPAYCNNDATDLVSCSVCGSTMLARVSDEGPFRCDVCVAFPSFQPHETDAVIDPAEHAAYALIDALTTLEQQIVLNYDLERANMLRKMMQRAFQHVDLVSGKAADRVDEILERRR